MRTQSDERLVVLARAGHERAFEAMVERYRGALLRAARRYLPEARAEDALQQAFISAWSGLQRGDEVRDLRPWLYRIVHNTALNQLRVSGYDYAELEDSLRAGDAPQEEMERRAVVRQTLTGLAALPERQREALLQIAVEGRSQDEVARELGVSEGAVRQLVHRARLTLRAAATVLVPLPVAEWAAAAGGSGVGAPMAERIAELIGGAGASAFLAKAGAVAVLATTTAVAGPAIVPSGADPPHPAAQRSTENPGRDRDPTSAPASSPAPVVATPALTPTPARRDQRGRAEERSGRGRSGSSNRRDRPRSGSGSSNSGSGSSESASHASEPESHSSGSGSSGSGSSGSGSSGSGSGSSGSGSSGSGSSGSSGSGSSGSGSSGSGSSGSGSPTPTAAPVATAAPTSSSGSGSSGSGSSGSGSSGSSGSGSSGSGHDGDDD